MTNGVVMSGFYLPSEDEFDPSTDDFVHQSLSKERQYKHFDLPLARSDREVQIDFSTEASKHRFWPFLGYTDISRRYTRDHDGDKKLTLKPRPIRFASHSDAAYLQAYGEHLNRFYEEAITKDGTAPSVLAYRRGGGTNIHHAKSLFDEIRQRQDCAVFALDISGFFDSLDHLLLRDGLKEILGVRRLIERTLGAWGGGCDVPRFHHPD